MYERMQRITFKAGPHGPVARAIAALDGALWDLRAKANGVPLWRELGGSSGRVAVYASGLDMALSDEELRTYYQRMSQQYGIRAGKLKVGRDLDRDLQRLAVVRDALGQGPDGSRPSLMIDANEFWSPKQADSATSRRSSATSISYGPRSRSAATITGDSRACRKPCVPLSPPGRT